MDENTPQFESDRATAWWRWFVRRSVLIPLAAVIVIAIGVWVGMRLNSHSTDNNAALTESIDKSNDALAKGDYKASYETLKKATPKATTDEEKSKLYNQLAASAASTGNIPEAIKYLEKRHEIDPKSEAQDAYMLGTYYERSGQKAKAIDQYNKAIDYAKSQNTGPNVSSDIQALEQRIQSLKG